MELQNIFRVRKVRNQEFWRINEHRKGEVVFGDIFYSKDVAEELAREANAFDSIKTFITGEGTTYETKWTGQFTTWCNK